MEIILGIIILIIAISVASFLLKVAFELIGGIFNFIWEIITLPFNILGWIFGFSNSGSSGQSGHSSQQSRDTNYRYQQEAARREAQAERRRAREQAREQQAYNDLHKNEILRARQDYPDKY